MYSSPPCRFHSAARRAESLLGVSLRLFQFHTSWVVLSGKHGALWTCSAADGPAGARSAGNSALHTVWLSFPRAQPRSRTAGPLCFGQGHCGPGLRATVCVLSYQVIPNRFPTALKPGREGGGPAPPPRRAPTPSNPLVRGSWLASLSPLPP